jgi:hypothetical protein
MAMAPILMAAMHEAATQVAEGADEAAYVAIIEELVARITTPPTPGRPGRKT